MATKARKRIQWKKEIAPVILETLKTHPKEQFPTVRGIWYYLSDALQLIPRITQTYKQVDKLLVALRKEGHIPFGHFEVKRGKSGNGAKNALDPEWLIDRTFKDLIGMPEDYSLPLMYDQPYLIEVWVEKMGVMPSFEKICDPLDIKVRSPEGFSPWEFVHEVTENLERYFKQRGARQLIILYFGDQDPSGIWIYEGVIEQLNFFGVNYQIERLGVTIEDMHAHQLPLAPKDPETMKKIRRDSRYPKYVGRYGEVFCELDSFISLSYDAWWEKVIGAITPLIDAESRSRRDRLNEEIRENIRNAIRPNIGDLEQMRDEIKARIAENGAR